MDDLIQAVLDAYSLIESDVSYLAGAIKDGILSSMQAAYARCSKVAGAVMKWLPSKRDVKSAEQLAQEHADSIAATYQSELENAATTFLTSYQDANGTLDGAVDPLTAMLDEWTGTRSDYKSEQIADYECGVGIDDGTGQFVSDLDSGGLIDTETGEVLSPDDYEIEVVPSESSSDLCSQYAGHTFDLSEYDSLPEFPAHSNCKHSKQIVSKL